jgi:2-oxoglutarate ferredoxin oxidoreductase subunit gamma
MYKELMIAGWGGQGCLAAAELIALVAFHADKHVVSTSSYGPESRGGFCKGCIFVSDEEIYSPVMTRPDTLIVMSADAFRKYISWVKPGGLIIVNSSVIKEKIARDDIEIIYIDALNIANQLGRDIVANVVLLGAYLAKEKIFSVEDVVKEIAMVFDKKEDKDELVRINKLALERGAQEVLTK